MKSPYCFLARRYDRCLVAAITILIAGAVAPANASVSKQSTVKPSISKISAPAATLPLVGRVVMVQVKGVAIPFTSFGIVHRLRTVPGVTSVQFNLKDGVAILHLAPNAHVTGDMLRAAVKNASYTPGNITWMLTKAQKEREVQNVHEAAQEAAVKNQTAPGQIKHTTPIP